MQIVILCGGLATRLGEIAKDTPKSMILIAKKPFLEHQINFLKHSGITDIVLCVGHLAEKIQEYFGDGERFGVRLRYSHDGDIPLGPIGALKKAEPLLDNIFFIMYGDSYVFVDFQRVYSYFLKQEVLALMTVYKNFDKIDASNIVVENGRITRVGKEQKTNNMVYIDYGVSILRKKALVRFPKDTFYSTIAFFTDLAQRKQLLAYEVKHRFYHIGTLESLEEFKTYMKKTKKKS